MGAIDRPKDTHVVAPLELVVLRPSSASVRSTTMPVVVDTLFKTVTCLVRYTLSSDDPAVPELSFWIHGAATLYSIW